MEKRSECSECGAPIGQPTTGRPRSYCSALCRRAAEYELRRIQSALGRADRAETGARMGAAVAPSGWTVPDPQAKARAAWWAGECTRLRALLRDTLAGVAASTDDATAAD